MNISPRPSSGTDPSGPKPSTVSSIVAALANRVPRKRDTSPIDHLKIAMIGTRGVPARYGGFETAVEEIGQRLVERGHRVTVYCRRDGDEQPKSYRGMRLVHLPAVHLK